MCDSCGEEGMNGDLVIVYDVNRNPSLGDIKVEKEGIFRKTASCELSMSNVTQDTILKLLYLPVF